MICWILSKIETYINLALFIDIALSAELNFRTILNADFYKKIFFFTVMERLIYRYGETDLCYGVVFIFKFLSMPFTKVKYI